jgi:Major Facilitator Superfamily
VTSSRRSGTLVAGLGTAQLVAWGSLYYAIAVLGEPMRLDLGVASSHLFGAFTWSLVIAGVLAPTAGRILDRHGGRTVLIASALLGAAGFLVLAQARSFPWIVVGWSINGTAMALGLYDACFAAIGQVEARRYRFVVTGVTLIAGFASTVAWPLSHYLLEAIGWRSVCHTYALALLLCALLYAVLLPGRAPPEVRATVPASPSSLASPARARLLSWSFAGTALIGGSISAHLPGMLNTLEIRPELAVWVASSIGALQVVGRVIDLASGPRRSAAQLGAVTFAGLLAAMLLLWATPSVPLSVFGFALLYGISNGLLTIARATLPVELFGLVRVGAVLGSFSAPSLVTRAFAPLGFALVAGAAGTTGAVGGLVAVGLVSLAAYVVAIRAAAVGGGS